MIRPNSKLEFQNIAISDIRVTEYQVRYPDQLSKYIELMLNHPLDAPGFILVKRMQDCNSTYEVLDGHHRFVAHIMTGRQTALCIVIEEPYEHRREAPSVDQPVRRDIMAESGRENGPDAGGGNLRAEEELGTAQRLALIDIFHAFHAGSDKKRESLLQQHASLFTALQRSEHLFINQE